MRSTPAAPDRRSGIATAPHAEPTDQAEAVPKLAPLPARATYSIDPVHSELSFRIRHLLGRVAGTFRDWSVSYDGPFLDIGQIGDEVRIEIAIEAVQQP